MSRTMTSFPNEVRIPLRVTLLTEAALDNNLYPKFAEITEPGGPERYQSFGGPGGLRNRTDITHIFEPQRTVARFDNLDMTYFFFYKGGPIAKAFIVPMTGALLWSDLDVEMGSTYITFEGYPWRE